MIIRIKFDDPTIKNGCEGIKEYLRNKDMPGEAALCEIDPNFQYMAYQMFHPNIVNNLNHVNKAMEQYLPMENRNQPYEDIEGTPGIIPATGNDIYNYVARYGMANFQIQTVMRLDGRLNQKRLLKAIRLSLDVEPVLGCRFIENQPPYWKRLDDIDQTIFCTFEETTNPDEAMQRFLESPLDMDHDPMVKLKLIGSGRYSTLCVKMNHTCSDGTGAKEYLQLLTDIYTHLDLKNDNYVPIPRLRSRRDQDRLFSALGISDPDTAWNPLSDIPLTMWPFPWHYGKPDTTRVYVCKMPNGHIDTMLKYGKDKGASINDLIVTAFYRAMFEMSQPLCGIPMDISMTVDLRRYLPDQKTEAIRNFSGGFNTRIARLLNEPFEGTLSRVVTMLDKVKTGRPGLQSAIGLEHVERDDLHQTLSFYKNASQFFIQTSGCLPQCTPVLSNMGYLDKSLFKFGRTAVTDAYLIPPALCAPGLLLCIGTYNGVITMSVSYYESQICRNDIERLLNLIKKELVEGCKA